MSGFSLHRFDKRDKGYREIFIMCSMPHLSVIGVCDRNILVDRTRVYSGNIRKLMISPNHGYGISR